MVPGRRLTVLVLALGAMPVWPGAQEDRAASVGVETVEMRELTETMPVFADVVATRDGIVASRIEGSVDMVHVIEGSEVALGDLLVELDVELLEIQRRQAEARIDEAGSGIATAEARLDRLETALARVEGLRDTPAFSEGRFDEARGEVFEARGQLAEAQARRASAEVDIAEVAYRIDNARIEAPFHGIVIEVSVSPGEYIAAGTPIVRLLDTDRLEVEASVPVDIVENLSRGMTVSAEIGSAKDVPLEVRALLPTEEGATRTRPVRLTSSAFAALTGRAVGQSLTVDMPVAEPREVLSVPKDALVQGQGGWTVFVDEGGVAQVRPVRVGTALGDRFEVLSGLSEGDVVVVRGNERLRPGQPVEAMPAGEGMMSDGSSEEDRAEVAN